MTGELSKEEQLQESLINWLLAGGNCAELVSQVQQFFQGVRESESCELDGYRAVELDRLIDSLEKPRWHAAKIDRNGGFPKLPPGQLGRKASAPIKVLVEMFEGVASCVRAEQPVEVHLWDRDVLDEQMAAGQQRHDGGADRLGLAANHGGDRVLELPHRPDVGRRDRSRGDHHVLEV